MDISSSKTPVIRGARNNQELNLNTVSIKLTLHSQLIKQNIMTSTVDENLESFCDFLASKGLRMTDQRRGVFEALFRQTGHFTAEQLLRDAQDLDETVSRATIYRCLPLLVESGITRKIDVGQDNKFYALNGTSQTFKAQVICSDCDRIFDIDAPFMEWYGKNVSEKLGLHVKDQRLQVHAQCPQHRQNGTCNQNN